MGLRVDVAGGEAGVELLGVAPWVEGEEGRRGEKRGREECEFQCSQHTQSTSAAQVQPQHHTEQYIYKAQNKAQHKAQHQAQHQHSHSTIQNNLFTWVAERPFGAGVVIKATAESRGALLLALGVVLSDVFRITAEGVRR